MNFNDAMDKMLHQAREMQRNVNEAMNKATEQMQPRLQESLKNAQELQATLGKHAAEMQTMGAEQAQKTMASLQEFTRMGTQAAQHSAEQARATLATMAEESKKVVDSMTAAMQRETHDHDHDHTA